MLERNWRSRRGELDIIAEKGDLTVFVEVKSRRGSGMGTPEEAVTPVKARRVRGLASEYLALKGGSREVRFDVISVEMDRSGRPIEIRHLQEAF